MHGFLDYMTAATLVALPNIVPMSGPTAAVVRLMGLGTAAYSALTDYELGFVKTLSFKAHLLVDALSAALFLAAPLLLKGEEAQTRTALLSIGLFEAAATLFTEPRAYQRGGVPEIDRTLSSVRAGK
jgi:hypothetical protein